MPPKKSDLKKYHGIPVSEAVEFRGEPYANIVRLAPEMIPVRGSRRARPHVRHLLRAGEGPSIVRYRDMTSEMMREAPLFDLLMLWRGLESPQAWGRTSAERKLVQSNYVNLRNELRRRGMYRPNTTD